MTRFYKYVTLILLILVSSSVFASSVSAQEKTNPAACSAIQKKLDKQIEKYDERKENHIKRYSQLQNRIKNLVEKLESKSYNTEVLKTDLAALDIKITKFSQDSEALTKKLDEAKGYKCGSSEGQFLQAISDARELLRVVHGDAADIRTYWHDTLREDIKDIRAQNPNN